MKIAVCGSDSQKHHLEMIGCLLEHLTHSGTEVEVERGFLSYLEASGLPTWELAAVDYLSPGTDLVVSLGGDGTLLRTAAWLRGQKVPVAGVNTGHLGYLAAYSFDDMDALLRSLDGEYEVSRRMMLEIDCAEMPADFHPHALNEVSVSKGDTTSMVNIQVYVNGQFLADYLADGLIVATPTGSTAYNLSCGGPIIEPTVECVAISPVAPHSLTLRPLVISAHSELLLKVSSRGAALCHVGVDGRTFSVPAEETILRIRKSGHIVNVAQPPGSFFAGVLRRKLRWGESPLRY